MIIQELIRNYKMNEKICESNIIKLSIMQNCFDDSLEDIIMFDNKEQTSYYEDMFNEFLSINNYICVEITEKQMKQYEDLQNQSITNDILHKGIPLVIGEKMEIEFKQKQAFKKATRLEKLQLEKYYMLQKLHDDVSEEFQSQLFDVFKKPNDKYIFINAYEEYIPVFDQSDILNWNFYSYFLIYYSHLHLTQYRTASYFFIIPLVSFRF